MQDNKMKNYAMYCTYKSGAESLEKKIKLRAVLEG
jgi:hypothetical protein